MDNLDARLDTIFAARDRENMAPTIDAFEAVRREYPDHVRVLYEVGGAYDTDGQEAKAVAFYERALAGGLSGDLRRRCLLQYGSTLRNCERIEESIEVFAAAVGEFPSSPALRVFQALTLHSAGQYDAAFASVLETLVEHTASDEIVRYQAALRGNAAFLREQQQADAGQADGDQTLT